MAQPDPINTRSTEQLSSEPRPVPDSETVWHAGAGTSVHPVSVSLLNRAGLELHSSLLPLLQQGSASGDARPSYQHTLEIALLAHTADTEQVDFLVESLARQGVATVLLSSLADQRKTHHCPASVIGRLINDETAAVQFSRLLQRLAANQRIHIVINRRPHNSLAQLLRNRGYSVEVFETVGETCAAGSSSRCPDLTVLQTGAEEPPGHLPGGEMGLAQDWVVVCEQQDSADRSAWLESGALAVFDSRDPLKDVSLQVARFADRAAQISNLRQSVCIDPVTGINTMAYLADTGAKMLASASRSDDCSVICVLRIANLELLFDAREQAIRSEAVKAAFFALSRELRQNDIVVQRDSNELVCLLACADPRQLRSLLDCLIELTTTAVSVLVDESGPNESRIPIVLAGAAMGRAGEVDSGYTAQLESLLNRASIALLQTRLPGNDKLLIL